MSGKPDDIPEDVWEAAREIGLGVFSIHGMIVIARAIMAERERCAKAGDDEHAECSGTGEWSDGYRAACENIVGAIRKGQPAGRQTLQEQDK